MFDITKILLLLVIITIIYIAYVSYQNMKNNTLPTEHFLSKINQHVSDVLTNDTMTNSVSDDMSNTQITNQQEQSETQDNTALLNKIVNKNRCFDSRINYAEGKRGNTDQPEWEEQFAAGTELTNCNNKLANDNFQPNESYGQALFKLEMKQNNAPYDMFDAAQLQPQEHNNDWFDQVPEPINVKNRNLINISRPIGVNTIGNSLRNPSLDIRGSPPCPKSVVSPFLNSTIEPDINIKSLN